MLPNIGIEIAILSIIILGTILSLYKLAKKLSHDYVEYQYRYNEYQKSKEEINKIETDLKKHTEYQEALYIRKKPLTQAEFEKWKAERDKQEP